MVQTPYVLLFFISNIFSYKLEGLPSYATKFIEMVLMLTADHGPAVSGFVLSI